jgi:hypothetical protein
MATTQPGLQFADPLKGRIIINRKITTYPLTILQKRKGYANPGAGRDGDKLLNL